MSKDYISCLWKQFCEAKGYDPRIENTPLLNQFIKWIKENKSLLYDYRYYLEILGIDIEERNTLEVNKGKFDSLYDKSINTSSVFGDTIGKEKESLIIERGIPYILSNEGIRIPKEELILTHNPYFESEIEKFAYIHNRGEKDISIGMFGKVTDENVEKKLSILENVRRKMLGDYLITFDTDNDNYFCTLNTKRYIKK